MMGTTTSSKYVIGRRKDRNRASQIVATITATSVSTASRWYDLLRVVYIVSPRGFLLGVSVCSHTRNALPNSEAKHIQNRVPQKASYLGVSCVSPVTPAGTLSRSGLGGLGRNRAVSSSVSCGSQVCSKEGRVFRGLR